MRLGGLMGVLLLVASACSADAGASGEPSVSIDAVDVAGSDVTLFITAGSSGDPVAISVSWGDGQSEPDVRGTGEFLYTHTYAPDVSEATISAQATASDGTVASDVSRVEIAAPAPTTTVVALGSTTTTLPPTTMPPTTTTTVPPTTTTVAPTTTSTSTTSTTTSTSPPTTTSTSTTTTTAAPTVVEVELDISKGTILDQWGSGLKESTWNGKVATASVARHADSWESDGIAVAFTIPASTYEDLKAGATSLRFEYTAYPVVDYVLDTDKLDGNTAEVKWEFMGAYDTTWSSNAKVKKIGAGFLTKGKNGDPFTGSWTLEPGAFGTPQRVHMFFQCRAKGPGGLIVGSDSKCDASLTVNAITVAIVRNE